ncbi:hypothetical protein ACP70R_049718 [Stipagrostis hirtigluma subsp. patula]
MEGSLCHEFETDLAAANVWEVYGGLLVGQLIPKLLPELLSKVELGEGDGGVGTVLLVTTAPAPGTKGSATYKEKFIKINNENYIKEAAVIEGGILDHGFRKYLMRIEIVRNEDKSSIIRSTIEYEVDEEHKSNASLASTNGLAAVAEAVTKYIKEHKSIDRTPEQT